MYCNKYYIIKPKTAKLGQISEVRPFKFCLVVTITTITLCLISAIISELASKLILNNIHSNATNVFVFH